MKTVMIIICIVGIVCLAALLPLRYETGYRDGVNDEGLRLKAQSYEETRMTIKESLADKECVYYGTVVMDANSSFVCDSVIISAGTGVVMAADGAVVSDNTFYMIGPDDDSFPIIIEGSSGYIINNYFMSH